MQNIYDKDYYEDGIATGKSCYQNYQWLPEMTIRMAYNLIKYLGLDERDLILDYGCAKGYLIKALRLLDIQAFGCDISQYAFEKMDPDVKEYCKLISPDLRIPFNEQFDWLITKDVMEHLYEDDLNLMLDQTRRSARNMFHIIPLGDGEKFRIEAYHNDPSHVHMKNEEWWRTKFGQHGWKVKRFDYQVRGIKENWTSKFPKGNGFFVLERV